MSQGLYYAEEWYWDQNNESRKWAGRYFKMMKKMPTMFHAGDASSVTHYLNAVKAVRLDADKAMAHMKETPINVFFTKNGMKIHQPSPQFQGELKKIGETMLNDWLKQTGAEGKSIIDAYRK